MKNKNRQLIINIISGIVVFCVQFFINFLLAPYLIDKLGEEAYGFVSLTNDFIQYTSLLMISINSMASRFISFEFNRGDKNAANKYFSSVFWMNVIASIVVFCVLLIILTQIERLISISDHLIVDVKIMMLVSFTGLIVSFLNTCFVSAPYVKNRMDLHSYLQIASNLVRFFVLLGLFAFLVPHIYYVGIALLSCNIVYLIGCFILTRRLTPEFHICTNGVDVKKIIVLLRAGIWILVSEISGLLLNGLDVLLANRFVGKAAMGKVAVSKQIPIAIGSLLGMLLNIFTAHFTTLVANNRHEELKHEVVFTLKLLGAILTPLFAIVIVLGRDFLLLWLPQSVYTAANIQQIYYLMLMTLFNTIVNAYMYSIHSLLIALNRIKAYSIMVLFSSILSVILTIILVSTTNGGVYVIVGISTIVLSFVNLLFVPLYADYAMRVKFTYFVRKIAKSYMVLVILILLFFSLKLILPTSTWLEFIVVCVLLCIIGYGISIMLFTNKVERTMIIAFIREKVKQKG